MKNAITNMAITGNNHMNTLNNSIATNIAIIINIKSLISISNYFIKCNI